MKEFTLEDINSYADKLLIGLTIEEAETILKEFSVIDANINQINEIKDLGSIEPAFFPYDLYTATLREDEAKESIPIDKILANCEDKIDREIKVPKVVS